MTNLSKAQLRAKSKGSSDYFFGRKAYRHLSGDLFTNRKVESDGFTGLKDGEYGWYFVFSDNFEATADGRPVRRLYKVGFMRPTGDVQFTNGGVGFSTIEPAIRNAKHKADEE